MKPGKPLVRRTRLVTKTTLQPGKGLARGTGLQRVTPMRTSRPRRAVPDATADLLAERSGGWCEAALPGCARRATDPHHRITTKSGGRHGEAKVVHDRLSDLIHLCRLCHRKVTDPVGQEREEYERRGLILKENQNPAAEAAVLRRGIGRVWLADDDRGYLRQAPSSEGAA